jgi:hypothetical protein
MDPRKTLLLEIKRKAGLATAAEIQTLENTPVYTGDGLVTPRPARDAEAWHRRYADERCTAYADAPAPDTSDDEAAPAAPDVIEYDDGTMQCDPANEPKPEGRENFPWARRIARQ